MLSSACFEWTRPSPLRTLLLPTMVLAVTLNGVEDHELTLQECFICTATDLINQPCPEAHKISPLQTKTVASLNSLDDTASASATEQGAEPTQVAPESSDAELSQASPDVDQRRSAGKGARIFGKGQGKAKAEAKAKMKGQAGNRISILSQLRSRSHQGELIELDSE